METTEHEEFAAPEISRSLHITGRISLICPYCGHQNTHSVRASTWAVRCQHRECRRKIAWCLMRVPKGGAARAAATAIEAAAPAVST